MAEPAPTTNDHGRLRRILWSPFVFVGFALVVVGALVVNVVLRTNSSASDAAVESDAASPGAVPDEASKLDALIERWQRLEDPDMGRVLEHSRDDLMQLLDRVCELANESRTQVSFDDRMRAAGADSLTDGMTGDHMHELGEGALVGWCPDANFEARAEAASS